MLAPLRAKDTPRARANAWLERLSLISHVFDMKSQFGHWAAEAFPKIVRDIPLELVRHHCDVMVTRWIVAKKAAAGINNRHSIIKLAIRLSMSQCLHEACLFH